MRYSMSEAFDMLAKNNPTWANWKSPGVHVNYIQIIQNTPLLAPELRSIYEKYSPEATNPNLYAMTNIFSRFLTSASISSMDIVLTDVDRQTLASLMQVYTDLILSDGFFLSYPHWIREVIASLGRLAMLLNQEGSSRLARAAIDRLLSKMDDICAKVWKERAAFRKHKEWGSALSGLIAQWVTAQNKRSLELPWNSTRLHVFLLCLVSKDESETSGIALYSSLLASTSEARGQRRLADFAKEAWDEHGPSILLSRFEKDLNDPLFVGAHLQICFTTIYVLLDPESFLKAKGQASFAGAVITAMRRARNVGVRDPYNLDWAMWHAASCILSWCTCGAAKTTVEPIVRQHRVVDVLAYGIILSTKSSVSKQALVPCTNIVRIFVEAARTAKRWEVEKPKDSYRTLQKDAWKEWYPALKALRGMRSHKSDYKDLLEAWEEFGAALKLDEEEARKVLTHKSISNPTPAQIFCAWRECLFYTQKPPYAMRKCVGCGDAFYCDKECQNRDWKEGGHKRKCRRLTMG